MERAPVSEWVTPGRTSSTMKRVRLQNGRASAVSQDRKRSFNAVTADKRMFPSLATPWEEGQARRLGAKPFPRYLVCSRTDGGTFTSTKPLFFVETIEDKFCEVESMGKLRSGSLLIKTVSEAQSEALLACTTLGDIPVTIVPHKSLNMVQGVIFHRDHLLQTDEELRAYLERRGVHFVRRVQRGPKDNRVDTGAFILAFEGDTLPEKVKIMIYRCEVKPYIPPPMRCFRCMRFGHMSSRCSPSVFGKEADELRGEGSAN